MGKSVKCSKDRLKMLEMENEGMMTPIKLVLIFISYPYLPFVT